MFESLEDCLHDQLKDLFSAENQLTKALPRMVKAARAEELQVALEKHLQETRTQVERLQNIAAELGCSVKGKKCKGMEGLIDESKEVIEEDGEDAAFDAALIAAAQKLEHYEIAAYGTARAMATQLKHAEVARLLQVTLDEEGAANNALTK